MGASPAIDRPLAVAGPDVVAAPDAPAAPRPSGTTGIAVPGLRDVRRRWPALVPLAVLVPALLGLAAMVGDGRLLVWDAPITDAAVAHRTAWLDGLALAISRLGSWVVVFPAGAALALAAARRSRALAWVIVAVVVTRPAVEWLLKDLVSRPRPDGARLVPGTGYSFPSGHVLAAAATWAFLPAVVALYTRRRALWWAAVGAAGALIVMVAWSRVWLGVHWASDVVASLFLAFLALNVAEAWLDRRPSPRPPANERAAQSPP